MDTGTKVINRGSYQGIDYSVEETDGRRHIRLKATKVAELLIRGASISLLNNIGDKSAHNVIDALLASIPNND